MLFYYIGGRMMNLKLVIFDMDGLMYDTEQIGMDCLINAAQKIWLCY